MVGARGRDLVRRPFQGASTRASLLVGGLLAALALWTLASLVWSPGAEKTFAEFNRVTLYLGVFALVTLVSSRRPRALGGRARRRGRSGGRDLSRKPARPGSLPERDLATFLPGAATRLSFPLGYWNGLAIFLALGVPLLLRVAVVARTSAVRGLALAPIPMTAAGIYLASSRGGVVAAVVGRGRVRRMYRTPLGRSDRARQSALGRRRRDRVLHDRDELVNGPLAPISSNGRDERTSAHRGRSASQRALRTLSARDCSRRAFGAPRLSSAGRASWRS